VHTVTSLVLVMSGELVKRGETWKAPEVPTH
jgi:hypothetical protein